tara:strand:+ start:5612 stop:6028 length:417 start_codon:yes stop_codon:yes gene_type:complete
MQLEVFEILQRFSEQPNRYQKIEFLKENAIPAIKDICRGAYDDKLEFILPEGKPPYTPNRPESTPSSLRQRHKDFGLFVKGARSAGTPQYKIENIFIQMLEAIHPEDALIVLNMVAKKAPVKGLTKKIVEEAFPNLLS